MKKLRAGLKKISPYLIVVLIMGTLMVGCSPAGDDKDQSPSGTDSGTQSETVQEPVTEQDPEVPDGASAETIPEENVNPSGESLTIPAAGTPDNPATGTTTLPSDETATDGTTETEPPVSIPEESPENTSEPAIHPDPAGPETTTGQGIDTTTETAISPEWDLLSSADVNHDGFDEGIYLDQTKTADGWVTLRIYDKDGSEIWNEGASTSHAGWNSIFLCEIDGEEYLLRYNPGMWQGSCTYSYFLFTLENGGEYVLRGDLIDFDINGTKDLDVPKMVSFAEDINELLSQSILLVSSQKGEYTFGPSPAEPFLERYSWLDETPELYEEDDDLGMRLFKYSEFAIANRETE